MKDEKVCEVKKIVLKIDDKEISLTMEQAKKLKSILLDLFGKDIVKQVIREEHHHYDRWYWQPYYQSPTIPPYPWTVYCGGTQITCDNQLQQISCSL